MSKKPKIALAMIAAPNDAEAGYLATCLKNTAEHVDGIFITITGENEKVQKVAESYDANISYFDWVDDFAKARNYNFSQVPEEYDYILWLDTDDVPRGIEHLHKVVKEHPTVDVFSMWYLYDFDEDKNPVVVHQKSRVVKNDGCVSWAGPLHEDFRENRRVSRWFVEDIEVLHLRSETRSDLSKERNLKVARKAMKTKAKDPRSYWNLGNSLISLGQKEESTKILQKFLKMSNSDEEKYLTRIRIAQTHMELGDFSKALENIQIAIGIRPEYPDAYHTAGHIYFSMKKFERAKESYIMGLSKKAPYHSIIVYNPREYDYHPLMALAKTYFNLSLPVQALTCLEGAHKIMPSNKSLKDVIKKMKVEVKKFEVVLKKIEKLKTMTDKKKLKKEIDSFDSEVRSHPAIVNLYNHHFVKEDSTGKDVVFFCGYTIHEWSPDSLKKGGVGGSEEAVIYLSDLLSKKGWNVTVYNNCGHQAKKYGDVMWKPYWEWNYRDKQDVIVMWRTPKLYDTKANADKVYVDLHDVLSEGEFTEGRLENITKILVKSKFHRDLFPKVSDDKFAIIPNGYDSSQFKGNEERDPYMILNTSSPERSVGALTRLFPQIKERVPEATLKWAYGWNVWDNVHGEDSDMMKWKQDMIRDMKSVDGFENLGKLSNKEVNKLYQQAGVFLYPTEFAEISCISAMKAQAGGAYPVTTDFAALDETVQFGYKVHSKKNKEDWLRDNSDYGTLTKDMDAEFVKHTVEALKSNADRKEMQKWAKDTYDWSKIADMWDKEFRE